MDDSSSDRVWWVMYKIPLILGSAGIGIVALAVLLLVKTVSVNKPIEYDSEALNTSSSSAAVTVDVGGGVGSPGVYNLPYGSRVEDAIRAAGGFSPKADLAVVAKTVNRAAMLADGQKVYVPVAVPATVDIAESDEGVSSQSVPSLISVNTATEAELDTLPGVGPATARKIIDNRPYQAIEEVAGKKAVPQSVFEKIRERISL